MVGKVIRSLFVLIGSGLLIGTCSTASAHDYWFETDAATGEHLLFRGHRFSEHDGDALEPYDPSVVKEANCAQSDSASPVTLVQQSYPLRVPATCAAIVVAIETGVWAVTEDGTVNAGLDEYPDALDAWESQENVKLITAWYAGLTEPLASGLEIVPTHDPFALAPDDKLRLRITLNGMPIPAAMVAYHGDWRGVTDSDGQINIRIRHRGLQNIAASIEEPSTEGTADRVVRTAILQFELP